MFKVFNLHIVVFLLLTTSCDRKTGQAGQFTENPQINGKCDRFSTTGSIEILDSALQRIINTNAKIEIIADSLVWAEGPLWLPEQQMLLFSDIPVNRIYRWDESSGLQLYLTPSGYTGQVERGGELGSNGLLLDAGGRLVLCQHGDRRVAQMKASLNDPQPQFITLTDKYNGQRLNSPNDGVYKSNGDLYFTDPPYGLGKNVVDQAKEIPFQGVYRLSRNGRLQLLTKALSRPNGIAFSPDEKILYVANSDPERAVWMAFDVDENGSIANARVFFDATSLTKNEKGLPDGLTVTKGGILFASGPGGILIINEEGKQLGTIKTGQITSNCVLNEDESILYITADNYVMRVKIK